MRQELTDAYGKEVHADFQKLGMEFGFNPPDVMRLRMYIMALPGLGKTTFVSSMPDTLVLDFEDSQRFVSDPKAPRQNIKSPEDFEKMIDLLCRLGPGTKENPFKHVVIDTLESMVAFMIPHYTKRINKTIGRPVADIREFGLGGAGWGRVNEWTLEYFRRLYTAGYGWTALGHLKEIVSVDKDKNIKISHAPLINDGIKSGIYREAQYVSCIRVKTSKVKVEVKLPGGRISREWKAEKQYLLELTTPDTEDIVTRLVKDRMGAHMPATINITGTDGWARFADAYRKAAERASS